ncbi:hypothetical protein [Sphingomonas daechungensis]|uniref:hypothetical protein n=1 Tax=Sphingomonas daechungensis TaxID=1176646 RepID=UPI003784E84A
MARPRRPEAEARLVREAAAIVRIEKGLTSAKALSREIAKIVVNELKHEIEGDELDLAFSAVERKLVGSPFLRLASCERIDTIAEFVDRRVERFRGRSGRQLGQAEDEAERSLILAEVQSILASRYDWQLRRER